MDLLIRIIEDFKDDILREDIYRDKGKDVLAELVGMCRRQTQGKYEKALCKDLGFSELEIRIIMSALTTIAMHRVALQLIKDEDVEEL